MKVEGTCFPRRECLNCPSDQAIYDIHDPAACSEAKTCLQLRQDLPYPRRYTLRSRSQHMGRNCTTTDSRVRYDRCVFISPLRFISTADEKVARVFDAPGGFVESLGSLGIVEDVGDTVNLGFKMGVNESSFFSG